MAALNSSHLTILCSDIFCPWHHLFLKKFTFLLKLCSWNTVCFLKHITSADKYLTIFSHKMEASVIISTQRCKSIYKLTKTDYFEALTPQISVHVSCLWCLFSENYRLYNNCYKIYCFWVISKDHSPWTSLCCLCSSLVTHRPLTVTWLWSIFSCLFL